MCLTPMDLSTILFQLQVISGKTANQSCEEQELSCKYKRIIVNGLKHDKKQWCPFMSPNTDAFQSKKNIILWCEMICNDNTFTSCTLHVVTDGYWSAFYQNRLTSRWLVPKLLTLKWSPSADGVCHVVMKLMFQKFLRSQINYHTVL